LVSRHAQATLAKEAMENLQRWFVSVKTFLDIPLLPIGETRFTLWMLLYLVVLLGSLVYFTGKLVSDTRFPFRS
jgi:hypothetical protein